MTTILLIVIFILSAVLVVAGYAIKRLQAENCIFSETITNAQWDEVQARIDSLKF